MMTTALPGETTHTCLLFLPECFVCLFLAFCRVRNEEGSDGHVMSSKVGASGEAEHVSFWKHGTHLTAISAPGFAICQLQGLKSHLWIYGD